MSAVIDIDVEGKRITSALRAILEKAKRAGIKNPALYFESEGSVYVLDRDHPKYNNHAASDRQEAVVARAFLHVVYDVGGW